MERRIAAEGGFRFRPLPVVAGLAVTAGLVVLVVLIAGGDPVGRSASPTERLIAEPIPVARPTATGGPEPSDPTATRPGSTEAQVARRRLSSLGGVLDADREPDPRTAAFVDRLRLTPPYGAVDSVVFDTLHQRLRLYGVWPVARDAVCRGDDGRRLACGLMARAALQNHIAGKEVVCDRMFGLAEPTSEPIEVRCRLDGEDLALRMIRAGWAFPSPRAGRLEQEALDEAMRARRGWWNGPQSAPVIDDSIADAAATPFGSLTQPAFTGPPEPPAGESASP
jgi:endonuclease YncB( thermonuclease family)